MILPLVIWLCALPCRGQLWTNIETARQAAEEARSSIYLMTDSAYDLSSVSDHARKGVKLKILIDIGAAKRSRDGLLRSLLNRGAVIWVAKKSGPDGTVMVVDGEYVLDVPNKVSTRDRSLAEDYIKKWHNEVSPDWVIPCK